MSDVAKLHIQNCFTDPSGGTLVEAKDGVVTIKDAAIIPLERYRELVGDQPTTSPA